MTRSERGFFTIELVVVLGLSSLIAIGAGMTVTQLITSTQRNDNQAVAVSHAQQAGYWISQDVICSQNITLGDDPCTSDDEFISIFWKDWENGDSYDIRYLWLNSGSLQKLNRTFVVRDRENVVTENKTRQVADYIAGAGFTQQGHVWQLNIQTHFGERTVSREYGIDQRQ
ncbi:MAG: hypothetical protein PHR56_00810 [Dehalococcoidales bacterium]|nr:hypothetical protein [Dehalococcoidales bacterium]